MNKMKRKMKPMWFDPIASFDELFEQIGGRAQWQHRRSSMISSWFKTGSESACLEVKPAAKVRQMIDRKVVAIDYDVLTFEAIDLQDGTSLIKLVHLRITDSHDVAIINNGTIPNFEGHSKFDTGASNHG